MSCINFGELQPQISGLKLQKHDLEKISVSKVSLQGASTKKTQRICKD